MKSKMFFVLVVFLSAAVGAGCSSKPPAASGVPMSSQMEPTEWNPQVMTYKNPDVNMYAYKRVLLLPVEIYAGPDADFHGASVEEQQEMAQYLRAHVEKVLREKGLLARQPGAGVASLKLILAGLDKTRPVASTVTHALPVGLALNLGKGAMGKNGSFMGSATVGGEFTDSTNGTLIASFLAKEAPNAMDIAAVPTTWGASKKAIEKIAEQIEDRLEKIQLGQR
jgi:hypothetical protein